MRTKAHMVCVLLALASCSPVSSKTSDGGNTPRALNSGAASELKALGYRRFEGMARIDSEVPEHDRWAARVTFDPASGPVCLRGDPYSAFYADRGSEDLAIILDGGGACWTRACNTNQLVDSVMSQFAEMWGYPLGSDWRNGLAAPLTFETFKNFASWNLVSAPYCDGSLFMGRGEVSETDGVVRYQHGRQNLAAALDLAVQHFPKPRRVLLAGFSAGGYGTITATLATRLRYPDAQLFVLNDSGPGLTNAAATQDVEQQRSEWNTDELIPSSCERCTSGMALSELLRWTLEHDSQVRISLASYMQDRVISQLLGLGGAQYGEKLLALSAELHTAYPERFRRFLLPGTGHVLGPLGLADDRPLSDYVVAMTNGDNSTWIDLVASSEIRCAHWDAASCIADEDCRVAHGDDVTGRPLDFLGCVAKSRTCDARETCAIDWNGGAGCATVSDSCVPPRWAQAACDTPGCPGKPVVATLPNCNLETVMNYVAADAVGSDCGALTLEASSADVATANACAVAAQQAGSGYRLAWRREATDDEVLAVNRDLSVSQPRLALEIEQGVLGTAQAAELIEYQFRATRETQLGEFLAANAAQTTTWTACSPGSRVASCGAANGQACLTCEASSRIDCSCQVSAFEQSGPEPTFNVTCAGDVR